MKLDHPLEVLSTMPKTCSELKKYSYYYHYLTLLLNLHEIIININITCQSFEVEFWGEKGGYQEDGQTTKGAQREPVTFEV